MYALFNFRDACRSFDAMSGFSYQPLLCPRHPVEVPVPMDWEYTSFDVIDFEPSDDCDAMDWEASDDCDAMDWEACDACVEMDWEACDACDDMDWEAYVSPEPPVDALLPMYKYREPYDDSQEMDDEPSDDSDPMDWEPSDDSDAMEDDDEDVNQLAAFLEGLSLRDNSDIDLLAAAFEGLSMQDNAPPPSQLTTEVHLLAEAFERLRLKDNAPPPSPRKTDVTDVDMLAVLFGGLSLDD